MNFYTNLSYYYNTYSNTITHIALPESSPPDLHSSVHETETKTKTHTCTQNQRLDKFRIQIQVQTSRVKEIKREWSPGHPPPYLSHLTGALTSNPALLSRTHSPEPPTPQAHNTFPAKAAHKRFQEDRTLYSAPTYTPRDGFSITTAYLSTFLNLVRIRLRR